MNTSLSQKKNWDNYFNEVIRHKDNIKLVIIGQDPYPEGANGVPFCKDNLKNIKSTSGGLILQRIGHQAFGDNDGVNTFIRLLESGILFMNLSYELLKNDEGKWLSKERIKKLLDDGYTRNQEILEMLPPEAIVLRLGTQKRINTFFNETYKNFFSEKFRIQSVIHPSPFNRKRESWINLWGNEAINTKDLLIATITTPTLHK